MKRCCYFQFIKKILSIFVLLFLVIFMGLFQQRYTNMLMKVERMKLSDAKDFAYIKPVKEIPHSPVRILCWILTNPNNLETKTVYIKKTWGPRCDITLYMSTIENTSFPTIGLNITENESKNLNSLKVKRAWIYIYEKYFNKVDFFMKTDDDTYVIVSNLRDFLSTKNPNVPEFYGRLFKEPNFNITYMSGGAGLILTKEALRKLYSQLKYKDGECIPFGAGEDWKICDCLKRAGAYPVDTRDSFGRERFLPFSLQDHFSGRYPDWFYKYDVHGAVEGKECCSEYPIALHYISGINFLTTEYQMEFVKRKNSTSLS